MPISDVKKKVLVTGGGGFIGSRLVHALLKKGFRVKVLDVQSGRLKEENNPNLEFIGIGSDELRGGMGDKDLVEQAVEDVDVIYHLAINWDGITWRHMLPLSDLFDANVRGTLNLLEAAKSHGIRHFLFSSSCAVYGKAGTQPAQLTPDTPVFHQAPSLIIDEESVCKPELWKGPPGPAYGILKLTTEKLCLMYYHHYRLPVTVFRIEVVWDENEVQFLSGKDVNKVQREEIVEVVEGDGFGTVQVVEVVQAFLLASLNEKAYGQVFNLSNPATYMSYRELYQFLIQLTGSKSEVRLLTDPRLISSVPESIEKIKRTLGWKPQKNREDVKRAIVQSVQSLLTRPKE